MYILSNLNLHVMYHHTYTILGPQARMNLEPMVRVESRAVNLDPLAAALPHLPELSLQVRRGRAACCSASAGLECFLFELAVGGTDWLRRNGCNSMQ